MLDFDAQLLGAREAAMPYRFLGDDPKPARHLVKPNSVGRRMGDVEPWPLRQPGTAFRVLVSAVVVDDQVHVKFVWVFLVDSPQ